MVSQQNEYIRAPTVTVGLTSYKNKTSSRTGLLTTARREMLATATQTRDDKIRANT